MTHPAGTHKGSDAQPSTEPKRNDDARRREDKEALEKQLDEELDDSFPASDPPSLTQDR